MPAHLSALTLAGSLQSMPRQRTLKKINEQKAERLKIVAAGLRTLEMGIERRIVRRAGKVLLLKGQMAVVLVNIHARQAKVYHVQNLRALAASQHKIVRLNVSVHNALGMNVPAPKGGKKTRGPSRKRMERAK